MKNILTIFIVLVCVLGLFLDFDENSIKLYNEAFDRAVYSFALAKGLNGVISVLQSSEINMSFFVGATIGIGQILDPINDLIERFSVIMLISSISLGVQHLFILLGKSICVKSILLFFSLILIMLIWIKKISNSFLFKITVKIFLLILVLRFATVFFMQANSLLYVNIYENDYKKSSSYIENYTKDLKIIQKNRNLEDSLSNLEKKSELFSKKVIKMATFFVITTIIFPILFIFFLIFVIKSIFNLKIEYNSIFKAG